MVSKICPDCGRRVSMCGNWTKTFCPWGCGSLENEPIVPELTAKDLDKELERFKNHIPRKIVQKEPIPEQKDFKLDLKGNLLLFGTKFIACN